VAGLGIVVAPAAMAVPNSVVISSFDPGPVGVSGTVTFTPAAAAAYLHVTVGLPASEYSTSSSGTCAADGITVAINGTSLPAVCGVGSSGSLNTIVVYNYWSSGPLTTSDVITLTWGSSVVTRTGASSASAFSISTTLGNTYMQVTPTLAGSSSSPSSSSGSSPAPDLTMWHQSIGRASSEDVCPSGYAASWALWPNGNHGGWVCNREVFAYRPEFAA
jgi:hypothetical protein